MADVALLFALFIVVLVTLAVLGGMAFVRTGRLREALLIAENQIRALEEAVQELALLQREGGAPPIRADEPAAAAETPKPQIDEDYGAWRKPEAKAPEPVAPQPIPEAAPKPAGFDAAAAAAARVRAPTPAAPRPPFMARMEKALASNWFVWIGGACIVVAIASILRLAIQYGWYGPTAQLVTVYVLGGGLIAGAEYLRRRPPEGMLAHTQLRHLPAVLAAAGLFAFFAATYAGYANLRVLIAPAAFAIMAAASVAAIALALRYGPWLAALGLAGGYAAPAMVRFGDPSAMALFGYLTALTAVALAVIKLKRWRGFVWLAAGGALFWAVGWIERGFDPDAQAAPAFYLVALAVLGAAFAWDEAKTPIRFDPPWRPRADWGESVFAAYVMAAVAALALYYLAVRGGHHPDVISALIVFTALAALAACFRETLALTPLGVALAGVGALLTWPELRAVDGGSTLIVDVNRLFVSAGSMGFVFSLGGWLMMVRNKSNGPGATLAAIGPVLVLLVAHEQVGDLRTPVMWGAAAIVLAVINTFALHHISRAMGGVDRAPGPAAAFALGASAAIAMAAYFTLTHFWLATALALMAPAMAWLDLRFRLPALQISQGVIAAIVVWMLVASAGPLFYPLSKTPIFNELLVGYGVAALALWGAAWLYRHGGESSETRLVQALETAALVLLAVGLSMEVRHLATHGDMRAPYATLAEFGGHVIAWLALAIGLASRFGAKPRPVLFWGELIVFGAALLHAFVMGVLVLNPWWGWSPAPAPGYPVFNLLLVAYGVPAAMLAGYAILRRSQGMHRRGLIAGACAMALAFLNVTLEVRRGFHPTDMANATMSSIEAVTITAAWALFSMALLWLGLIRRKPSLRYASLIVLIAALLKTGIDILALPVLLRAISLLGLGLLAVGVTVVYQRFVFPRTLRSDPNLIPPR